ncbi:transposable element Tc1 transposase [Trichonephila clavipes]|nr:transposable element Tc1 transposase [Trichonephila clavipes]
MQDNSPIHTARITTSWLENNQIKVLDWPAKCPDLNPIENVWAEMERISNNRNVSSLTDLWELVQTTFYDLMTVEYLQSLFESMPNRIKKVIEAKGGWTKY